MRTPTFFSLIYMFLFLGNSAQAGVYSGQWEYQALNAGDTNFNVEQNGKEIKLYRVLFPEYQGSRFKLEHIYKGKLKGSHISGFLFVREEGMKEFEKLREFQGEIRSENKMVVDDLPLMRIASAKISKVVIKEGARKNHASVNDSEKVHPAHQKQVSSEAPVGAIPRLIPVNRKILIARHEKTDKILRKADSLYGDKNYELALSEYSSAYEEDSHRLELLYKLGLCHGVLGNRAARTGKRAKAIDHYAHAIDFWSKAVRLDPYNNGAKENIRRARKKLGKLKRG